MSYDPDRTRQARETCTDHASFKALCAVNLATNVSCYACGEVFSPANTHTVQGWKETQISGMCEDCFDALFEEDPLD